MKLSMESKQGICEKRRVFRISFSFFFGCGNAFLYKRWANHDSTCRFVYSVKLAPEPSHELPSSFLVGVNQMFRVLSLQTCSSAISTDLTRR